MSALVFICFIFLILGAEKCACFCVPQPFFSSIAKSLQRVITFQYETLQFLLLKVVRALQFQCCNACQLPMVASLLNLLSISIYIVQPPRKTKHHHLGKHYESYLCGGKQSNVVRKGKHQGVACLQAYFVTLVQVVVLIGTLVTKLDHFVPCTSDKNNINISWLLREIILASSEVPISEFWSGLTNNFNIIWLYWEITLLQNSPIYPL